MDLKEDKLLRDLPTTHEECRELLLFYGGLICQAEKCSKPDNDFLETLDEIISHLRYRYVVYKRVDDDESLNFIIMYERLHPRMKLSHDLIQCDETSTEELQTLPADVQSMPTIQDDQCICEEVVPVEHKSQSESPQPDIPEETTPSKGSVQQCNVVEVPSVVESSKLSDVVEVRANDIRPNIYRQFGQFMSQPNDLLPLAIQCDSPSLSKMDDRVVHWTTNESIHPDDITRLSHIPRWKARLIRKYKYFVTGKLFRKFSLETKIRAQVMLSDCGYSTRSEDELLMLCPRAAQASRIPSLLKLSLRTSNRSFLGSI